jgi:hypothetical protein
MDGDERYPIRPGSPPGRGRSRTPPGRAAGAGMAPASAYTLLAAGRRTGKTSLLRLLLDTAPTAASAHGEQYAAVARFVQGAPSTTTHIRACALDVVPDGRAQPVALELVDTPALDFADEDGAERVLAEISASTRSAPSSSAKSSAASSTPPRSVGPARGARACASSHVMSVIPGRRPG